MNIIMFSAEDYERPFYERINADHGHELTYIEARLTCDTVGLAEGYEGLCAFINDNLNADILKTLAQGGTKLIALRSAGFNNVDLAAAKEHGLSVVRVPAYSPHAVAEHAMCLMLALNRKVHRAYNRVREGNFALHGLMGFDMHGKTAGIIGTGKIGQCMAEMLNGFGCCLLGFDPKENPACKELGLAYVDLETLLAESDIITLHCPLTPDTEHLIDASALSHLKEGAMLINTSRGGVVDTEAVLKALKTQRIGSLALDVYEEESDVFFRNLSDTVLQDDVLARLLTFPNVIVTGHQGFFTRDALQAIADTTLKNITEFAQNGECENELSHEAHMPDDADSD